MSDTRLANLRILAYLTMSIACFGLLFVFGTQGYPPELGQ